MRRAGEAEGHPTEAAGHLLQPLGASPPGAALMQMLLQADPLLVLCELQGSKSLEAVPETS